MFTKQIMIASLLLNLSAAWAHEVTVPKQLDDLVLQQLSDELYIIQGPQQFPSPETAGFMNNPGFVVTPGGVVVIDPGSSVQIGQVLVEKIKQVSPLPVVAVFNTHVHGDHWLGNQAILKAWPEVSIYAHERMIERVESGEGEDWISNFNASTAGATAGTEVVVPNIGLLGGETLNIGGIVFQIYHTGKAHTDNDLMIELKQQKSIFLGDIVTDRRIQSARPEDSDIKGQIKAVEFALQTDNTLFIPGHGAVGGKEMVERQLHFLRDLLAAVEKYYEQGLSDYEMKDLVMRDLSDYGQWFNFSEIGRVIAYIYLKVEEDSF